MWCSASGEVNGGGFYRSRAVRVYMTIKVLSVSDSRLPVTRNTSRFEPGITWPLLVAKKRNNKINYYDKLIYFGQSTFVW